MSDEFWVNEDDVVLDPEVVDLSHHVFWMGISFFAGGVAGVMFYLALTLS